MRDFHKFKIKKNTKLRSNSHRQENDEEYQQTCSRDDWQPLFANALDYTHSQVLIL